MITKREKISSGSTEDMSHHNIDPTPRREWKDGHISTGDRDRNQAHILRLKVFDGLKRAVDRRGAGPMPVVKVVATWVDNCSFMSCGRRRS